MFLISIGSVHSMQLVINLPLKICKPGGKKREENQTTEKICYSGTSVQVVTISMAKMHANASLIQSLSTILKMREGCLCPLQLVI